MREEGGISWSCAVTKMRDSCCVLLCALRRKGSPWFSQREMF